MPRVAFSLLKRAREINPLLVLLVRTTRCLRSAQNELRWLQEHSSALYALPPYHVSTAHRPRSPYSDIHDAVFLFKSAAAKRQREWLRKACIARGRGTPLQYILGTTFFGELELLCKRGVLIPREETAEITSYLVKRLHPVQILLTKEEKKKRLHVLDLCTGTGCMALLFCHAFLHGKGGVKANSTAIMAPAQFTENKGPEVDLEMLGIDISQRALRCAKANLTRLRNQQLLPDTCAERAKIDFAWLDVLGSEASKHLQRLWNVRAGGGESWDIVLANPPYISSEAYRGGTTEKSVRGFEPQSALVPAGPDTDIFYKNILNLAERVKAKVVLFEVGDMPQAQRVAGLALTRTHPKNEKSLKIKLHGQVDVEESVWEGVEIWRDGVYYHHSSTPSLSDDGKKAISTMNMEDGKNRKTILGPLENDARAVLCFTTEGQSWLRSPPPK